MIENILDENFKEKVLEKKDLILVDFWAPWCSPCKALAKVLEKIDKEVNFIKIYKIDIDKNNKISEKYKIMSIPTILLFKNGKVIDTITGFLDKDKIKNRIEAMK